tara:strand:+ start:1638 stop:2396 length:759 start_codon:yes stop_codon:yes gene_type:complete
LKIPKDYLLSDLLNHNVKADVNLSFGAGENVWMHPPVHRILGWYSRPSNLNLKRNVWRLNQVTQIIDNDIYIKGNPAISDLATLNRFPNLLFANLVNSKGSKIGVIADFLFEFKTGNIKYYLISRSNPKIPGSSRWKLNINNIVDQQPGLVFCSLESLDQLSLVKSSLKNRFLQKGKKLFDRVDDMKNVAANKLEDWLEEEETYFPNNNSQKAESLDIDEFFDFNRKEDKQFYSDNINSSSSNKKKEDDPWI